MKFQDIIYTKENRVARISINRPEKYNACTPVTLHELVKAFIDAWTDDSVGVVVFTGEGDKAFCTGGDQSIRELGGYKGYSAKELEGSIAALPLEVAWQFVTFLIRHIPKPVIARVNGYAIGGGHVWQVNCDLSIASDKAKFGQAGPRVGSFDPGFGTGDLWRNVGMKRAKEIWYLCRIYTAEEAYQMGLKYAFLAESDGLGGVTELGVGGLSLYYGTEESAEGKNAFIEKRKPDFWKHFRKV
ncbi:MAG: enoyl-CoA hydratase/isomerase family protein [Deltaproteobacteria bacterium]|nr:enoyl-CoA hydratase/isomerase family protein [Deltaproteobacteria bacterium]